MKVRFQVALTALVALPAMTQTIEVGIKGGVPIIEAFRVNYGCSRFGCFGANSATRRYVVGAAIEIRLPSFFSLEFNTIYKRLGYDTMSASLGNFAVIHYSTTANSWELPLIARYRLSPLRRVKANAGGGVAFRRLTGLQNHLGEHTFYQSFSPPVIVSQPYQPPEPSGYVQSDYGGVAAFGVDLRAGRVRFSPELRYTRWASETYAGAYYSRRNQTEFLLGIGVVSGPGGEATYHDFSDRFRFGVAAGIPLTTAILGEGSLPPFLLQFNSMTRRYILGGAIEGALAHGFSLEFNALWRRLGYHLDFQGGFTQAASATAWDFPLFVKHCLPALRVGAPHAGAGVVFRHVSVSGSAGSDFYLRRRLIPGAAFTTGLQFRAGRMRIIPEIRYTRWSAENFSSFSGLPVSNRNQVDALLGVSYGRTRP